MSIQVRVSDKGTCELYRLIGAEYRFMLAIQVHVNVNTGSTVFFIAPQFKAWSMSINLNPH
jgi:hypothetical protein